MPWSHNLLLLSKRLNDETTPYYAQETVTKGWNRDLLLNAIKLSDQRYSDRLTYDGTWENNLFNFIRMVIPKLTRDLPHPFSMDGVLRLPIEQIYKGVESKARNQRMQNMFRMIGYGENLGSVFPLILNAWNEKHWIKPKLQEQPELMQVKLTLHIQNDVSYSSSNDPINDPKNDQINLTERQKLILRMFSEEKNLSRERLCEKTGLSDATAKREIAFLKKTGYLERVGSFKSGYWKVYQNNCILGQMFNGWKITLNIWTHYLPSTSPPTRRCTYATSAHHPNLCLVPNHSMASHHRHKTLHRL